MSKIITFSQKGDFSKTERFLKKMRNPINLEILKKYGQKGVTELSIATPKRTGTTASSWYYEIKTESNGVSLNFCNKNINNEVPIAIIIQYGHATKNGTWVQGVDYINPALKPIFESLAEDVWKEVIS